MMNFHTLTIVGVGLLGGSIGLAAKQRDLVRRVVGVGHQWPSLALAQRRGAIDEGTLDLAAGVREADLIVLCTPVDRIVEQALTVSANCPSDALLTDVGSTKAAIVRSLDGRLPRGLAFVGGHPLAGSEKRGVEFAEPDLFEGRLTVLTPTETTDPGAVERVALFWQALGSRVRVLSPEEHDRALALTSHLPHLLASALAGILPENLFDLAATGFRDTTRIAAGDPSLWTGIFQQNRQAVLQALELFSARLGEFHQALQSNDRNTIDSLLAQAKKVRDALGNRDPIQR
jgi:prephenate dehydrogenase